MTEAGGNSNESSSGEFSPSLADSDNCLSLVGAILLKFLLTLLLCKFIIKQVLQWRQWRQRRQQQHAFGLQVNRKVVGKFRRRKVIVCHIDEIWSSDVLDMQKFADENYLEPPSPRRGGRRGKQPKKKNFRYILVVIDCFSKYLWLEPMKSVSYTHLTLPTIYSV